MYIRIYIYYMHTYVHIYINIYTYTLTHIFIHTCILDSHRGHARVTPKLSSRAFSRREEQYNTHKNTCS